MPEGTLSISLLRVLVDAALEVDLSISLLRVFIACIIPSLVETFLPVQHRADRGRLRIVDHPCLPLGLMDLYFRPVVN